MISYSIGCILTAYKRLHILPLQLEHVLKQTIRPSEIFVWNNSEKQLDNEIVKQVNVVVSASKNMGVWPRFMLGFELNTEYVCVFDDDNLPGKKWFENCIECMQKEEAVYGACGRIFPTGFRDRFIGIGCGNPQETVTEVDQVGHNIFFKKDWLRYFALEPRKGNMTCGEVYHISVAAQKHLGLKTYVPPFPKNDREKWGSLTEVYGNDNNALWKQPGERENKDKMHKQYIQAGWIPIALRDKDFTTRCKK